MTQATLAERVLAGDPRALARAISLIEDESPAGADLIRGIFASTGRAFLIGVTGPPGAGKSTLVDKLTVALRASGRTVGMCPPDRRLGRTPSPSPSRNPIPETEC